MAPIDILIRPGLQYIVVQGCTEAGIHFVENLPAIETAHAIETAYRGMKQIYEDSFAEKVFDLMTLAGLISWIT